MIQHAPCRPGHTVIATRDRAVQGSAVLTVAGHPPHRRGQARQEGTAPSRHGRGLSSAPR
ncbi:hypothetical protein SCATT_p06450 (plasmid) [Streptantibioticus cattleyicolor NRRL 8057 = DSM 46488]|uniref:Uncharacterized protein n=1 Tax=Streptantibioticus cattleyicolor (strain ATCC 35852 / DSM 46488 / JCM 4925 / NBRC 14057 / NRRL 8057) TaxID=1003195 RepID=G8XH92_STREN|nr:hypothetical protein SCATT_p06450 [Streptantibioticus cattleyicolor NRRL 8057 = DSM 46488]